jgi:hypothetical protein
LQRGKGRDLLDLAVFPDLNKARVVECLGLYLQRASLAISRAEVEQRMFAKLAAPRFVTDMRPLLSAEEAELMTDDAVRQAFISVLRDLVALIPGASWAKTPERLERYGLSLTEHG